MEGGKYNSGKRGRHLNSDDGNRRNKRRNFDGERGSAPAMPGVNDTVYRILCPGEKIGSVIGKGGDIIKSLRQETHAKIKIADSIPGVVERVIIIYSPPKDDRNKNSDDKGNDEEIDDVGKDGSDSEPLCPAQHALFRVHERIIEEERGGASDYEDDDKDRSHDIKARLLVPNNQIGCLLGKGGKIIAKMRSDTGAQIRIMSKEQLPLCAMDVDELVQISGELSAVKKALYEISARLHENPSKQRLEFNNPSRAAYASGNPVFSSVNLLPQGNPLWPNQNPGATVVGLGGSMPFFGGYGSETGSAWQINPSGFPAASGFGGPTHREGGQGQEFVLRVLCPNDRVGGVIGKSGSTVNQIRQDSGANVKISDTMPESEETEIVVSASEFVDNPVSPVIEAALILQVRTTSRSASEGHITTRLLVPSNQIGCLIGKGGNIISEMRRATRADIRVLPKDNVPKCALQNDELVQISGETNFARDALVQIASRLRAKAFQDIDGAGKGSTGAPLTKYTLTNPAVHMTSHYSGRQERLSPGGMYSSSGFGYQDTGGRTPSASYFGSMQSGGSGYDPIQGYSSSHANDDSYSGGFMKNVSTSTVEVAIPKDSVGSVLGKRGSNMEHIREISGAKVKLYDSRSGASDRVIEISGTPEQTHAAKSLLQAFLATGGQGQPTRGTSRAY